MTDQPTCNTCRFYDVPGNLCRRRSPVAYGTPEMPAANPDEAVWPRVNRHRDWCGEYQMKEWEDMHEPVYVRVRELEDQVERLRVRGVWMDSQLRFFVDAVQAGTQPMGVGGIRDEIFRIMDGGEKQR